MYTAKEKHLGVARYTAIQNRFAAADLALLAELRHAIESDQLVLHYQPQVTIGDGRIDAVEALVRWNHPTHGLMYPDRFIPLAEQTDLINRLTEWVVRRALEDQPQLRADGRMTVSINVSARNLSRSGFAAEVVSTLQSAGVASHQLIVEVTETALMTDPVRASIVLDELNRAGVRVSIDDFGVGQTSLSYLATLPITELKIDRGFITDILEDESHAAIVNSIIDLGHNLGFHVVGEGVESKEVLAALDDAGCDVAQGYYFAKPMTIEHLSEWLHQHELTQRV